jgi:hypothetical protein
VVRTVRLIFYCFFASFLLFWVVGVCVAVSNWSSPPRVALADRIIFLLVWLCVGVGMTGCWLSVSDVTSRFAGLVDPQAQRQGRLGRKLFLGAWLIGLLLMGLGVVL